MPGVWPIPLGTPLSALLVGASLPTTPCSIAGSYNSRVRSGHAAYLKHLAKEAYERSDDTCTTTGE